MTDEEIKSPFENTIGVMLSQHKWGTQRKVRSNEARAVTLDGERVSEEAVALSKKLIRSDEYDAIGSLDGAIRTELEKLSVPSVLRKGVILIPFLLFEQAMTKLVEYQEQRRVLVSRFADSYERAVDRARETLGPSLFRSEQYPSARVIANKFWVDVSTVDFNVSGNLKTLNRKLWEEERAKLQANMREATEEIRSVLRASLLDLVGHLSERLSGENEDGKPKIFRDASIKNLNEWLELFSARNVTDDQDLDELVQRCRQAMVGVDAEDLRKRTDIRKETASNLQTIKAQLDTMMVNSPSRKFSFDDDAQ
jgi:hypothetical protein